MEKEGDTDFAIHVAVVDDAVTVTMPGTFQAAIRCLDATSQSRVYAGDKRRCRLCSHRF